MRRSLPQALRCCLAAVLVLALPPAGLGARTALAQSSAEDNASPLIDAAALAPDEAADPDEAQLRDIKPLRPPKPALWPYVLAAIAVIILLALGAWLWWRRRQQTRAQAEQARSVRPPHEVALAALQALHRVNFADEAAVRQYYFAISEVLRAYVTARFNLTASQLTTEEIFSRLPKLVELAPPENLRLRAFLAQTDQVKYALHQATPEEIGATYEQALGFIEATTPSAPPPAQNSAGAP